MTWRGIDCLRWLNGMMANGRSPCICPWHEEANEFFHVMWKGIELVEKNQICKFKLISNEKNHLKINNYCSIGKTFAKKSPYTSLTVFWQCQKHCERSHKVTNK
jgi:hypothetical protein